MEQAHSNEKRLTIELAHTKELNEAQLAQLQVTTAHSNVSNINTFIKQKEIDTLQSEQSKLSAKHKKLLNIHQVLCIPV